MDKLYSDLSKKDINMYGVLPCPKCRSRFRYPLGPDADKDANKICCDDCGLRVDYEKATGGE